MGADGDHAESALLIGVSQPAEGQEVRVEL